VIALSPMRVPEVGYIVRAVASQLDCYRQLTKLTTGAGHTIGHELKHIRKSMATGTFPEGEGPATEAGDLAEWYSR
jgi:hypothetical protein